MFLGVAMMRYFSAFRLFGEIRNINLMAMYVSCVSKQLVIVRKRLNKSLCKISSSPVAQ